MASFAREDIVDATVGAPGAGERPPPIASVSSIGLVRFRIDPTRVVRRLGAGPAMTIMSPFLPKPRLVRAFQGRG
jgi:hypothetical protein